MSKRIFRSVVFVSLLVFVATLLLAMAVSYSYFTDLLTSHLRGEIVRISSAVERAGVELQALEMNDCRITWIAPDGTVLFDSRSSASYSNHLEREEVREALETGHGESSRLSATSGEKLYYVAQRLADGTVLRLSVSQYSLPRLILGTLEPLLLILVGAVLLSLLLARRLSRKLVEPMTALNLNEPINPEEGFEELRPLLQRLSAQQKQLMEDQVTLNKTEEIRREFTANVSHELKTPLHTISGYAELLKDGLVRHEDIQPFAGKIYSEAFRMTTLVDDIIELSRLDEGGGDMEKRQCDLSVIAANALDSLSAAAAEKNVTMTSYGGPAPLVGVPHLLYGIVYNLCDNAIKYNRPGGSVVVSVTDTGSEAVLRVSDTGIGIPAEHQDRVFERFYRVDKSHSKDVGGTGLGLSIVKHAALIHAAHITLDSAPGEGTTVTVTFPRLPEND